MNYIFKYAALDTTVHEIVSGVFRSHLPAGEEPAPDDVLEELLPEDGVLEQAVNTIEENFGVQLSPEKTFELFVEGTVADLEKAVVGELMEKTAKDRKYYMQHRTKILQKQRQYRMKNLHKIRRRAKIYRAKVKRRQVRPKKRIGSRSGGYILIHR